MGVRQHPSHRIRQATGPSRPALGPLAEFWTTFDPREPKEIILRLHSAPWDDIIMEEDDTQQVDKLASTDDTASLEDDEELQDSPTINLLRRQPPPTHYKSVVVQPAAPTIVIPDIPSAAILAERAHLPPPEDPVPVFMKTQETALMTEVIRNLQQNNTLVPVPDIVYAFRMFLVAKSSGAARPVYGMSKWTPLYSPPPVRLYSAAEVLATIPGTAG
jgi:hypothetical protein